MTRLLAETVLTDFGVWLMIRLALPMVIENVLGTPYHVAKSANPFERERLQTILMSILSVSRRRAGRSNDATVVSSLRPVDLERIEAPLVISVENDRYGTFPGPQYTAGRTRNARFIGFSTGGHRWLGHNEEVSTSVRDFLQHAVRHRSRVRAAIEKAEPE